MFRKYVNFYLSTLVTVYHDDFYVKKMHLTSVRFTFGLKGCQLYQMQAIQTDTDL